MHVGTTGSLFIQVDHPAYPHVIDFLVSCCEPVSRTQRMEEYRLDSASLSAASAEGTYTCGMIRELLRHFRLNADQEIAVDLARYEALERWAGTDAAAADAMSYRQLPFVAELLKGSTALETSSAPPLQQLHDAADSEDEVKRVKVEKQEEEEKSTAAPAPRRLLSLKVPSSTAGATTAAATPTPLVSLAVVRPAALQPLPSAIEDMLVEELSASRLRVVLQPRLRRFHSAVSHKTARRPEARSVGAEAPASDEELFYFLVSTDRAHMEEVVTRVQQFLEPVMLQGAPRYIISDVDRGREEQQHSAAEGGKTAALRRLFASSQDHGGADAHARSRIVYKCQVRPGCLRDVKSFLYKHLAIRADCFYDYLQDKTLHVEGLALGSHVRLRPYQVASLERFRRGCKAHQGVVVLPCGAGKTLTGIGAAATVQKRTIVLTVNSMSVFQWQREFLRWTNLTADDVTVCTRNEKQMPASVFITTYSMVIAKRGEARGKTAMESEAILREVASGAWGLLIMDEVHTAPAHNFQQVLNRIKYKCVLGLSATLLREDGRIDDLRHLVGPKLYEANWLQLTRAGFLARAECAEVQCPLPVDYFTAYHEALKNALVEGGGRGRPRRGRPAQRRDPDDKGDSQAYMAHSYASCNPYKLWCTQALLAFHRSRSPPDKVIIFCDYLSEVRYYSHHLHLPFMSRETGETERRNLLDYFQYSDLNAIILTRVGDVALDLPCASVIIQVSGLGASRRQEAQRLGRILRPKPPSLDNTCSYFYTLVSQDTSEVQTSYERQSWLRDQGFAYRVLYADGVLREFTRRGGVPCCIGPPRWWYQVPEGGPASPRQEREKKKHTLRLQPPGQHRGTVVHDGCRWAPFSPAASLKIHQSFQHGREGCALDASAFPAEGPPPPPLGASCAIHFSSVDAPATFGTVVFGDGGQGARRVTFGQLGGKHECMPHAHETLEPTPCVSYALEELRAHKRGKRAEGEGEGGTAEASSSSSGDDEEEEDEEEDYDDDNNEEFNGGGDELFA